jgi:PhnB protein
MPTAKPIPDGYRSVQPYLTVNGADRAIQFYTRVFGAKEVVRMPSPDGKKLFHAEIKIGDSIVMLSDEFKEMGSTSPETLGGSPVAVMLYVNDVDRVYQAAIDAGAKVKMPLADMFWGDRFGMVIDPFGHHWALATHKEDVSPEEMKKREADYIQKSKEAQMAKSSR